MKPSCSRYFTKSVQEACCLGSQVHRTLGTPRSRTLSSVVLNLGVPTHQPVFHLTTHKPTCPPKTHPTHPPTLRWFPVRVEFERNQESDIIRLQGTCSKYSILLGVTGFSRWPRGSVALPLDFRSQHRPRDSPASFQAPPERDPEGPLRTERKPSQLDVGSTEPLPRSQECRQSRSGTGAQGFCVALSGSVGKQRRKKGKPSGLNSDIAVSQSWDLCRYYIPF